MARTKLLDTVCWPSVEYMQPDSLMGWTVEHVRKSDTIQGAVDIILAMGKTRRIVTMDPIPGDEFDPIHIEIFTAPFWGSSEENTR